MRTLVGVPAKADTGLTGTNACLYVSNLSRFARDSGLTLPVAIGSSPASKPDFAVQSAMVGGNARASDLFATNFDLD